MAHVGGAFIAHAVKLGIPTIAVHKGLSTTLGYTSPHASPADIGLAAKNHPDARFVAYHGVVSDPSPARYLRLMTDGTDTRPGWGEYEVRDETVIPASAAAVWAVLSDLSTWVDWWTLMQIEPLDPSALSTVAPGIRVRFEGRRPGSTSTRSWNVEVREVVENERIALEYTDGDLVGHTAWELTPEPGGTRVAYVYYGVRATTDGAAATFAKYGTRLHSAAMTVDGLAGLARAVAGEPLDDAWRAEVQAAMANRVTKLDWVSG